MTKSNKDLSQINPNFIVVYFDFDGTLTRYDTLIPFLIFCVGLKEFLLKSPRLLMILINYVFKLIDNSTAKAAAIDILFKTKTHKFLLQQAKNFADHRLDRFLQANLFKKLEWHREMGHKIILVSANLAIYLRPWAFRHGLFDVIATELEVKHGILTGKLATSNCYAEHKVSRIKAYLQQKNLKFEYSYGYGNSRGDYEMLDYVIEGYFVTATKIISWSNYNDKLLY